MPIKKTIEEFIHDSKILYIMRGIPGSGKSTVSKFAS